MNENNSKESSKKKSTESIKKGQMELPFNSNKQLPCSSFSQAKVIEITTIKEKKKLDLINQIIQNSPSF